jgi:hypothetical protein
MLDLAIAFDHDRRMTTIVETNRGVSLRASGWPQDSDFNLVAFDPNQNSCDVVAASELAADISKLVRLAASRGILRGKKPAWLKRLEQYSSGVQASD